MACWRTEFLGLSYTEALHVVTATAVLSGVWLWAASERLAVKPGRARLAAALPVVVANVLLPLLFCRWQDATSIMLTCFNFLWLSSFKALAWAMGRGPLCCEHYSFSQFLAVYAAPITPVAAVAGLSSEPSSSSLAAGLGGAAGGGSTASLASSAAAQDGTQLAPAGPAASANGGGKLSKPEPAAASAAAGQAAAAGNGSAGQKRGGRMEEDAGSWVSMAGSWSAKAASVGLLVWILQYPLPGPVRALVYTLSLYALLSLIMDGPAALIIGLTGLRVSPHFDRPWLSTSVASFWSKRWDLAAGNALRTVIFDSIVDGSLLPPPPGTPHQRPSPGRQLLASTATFGASGLLHELVFWYLTGHTTDGLWLAFFLVQVPYIVLERVVLAAARKRRIHLPSWVRQQATMHLLVPTSYLLFWKPTEEHGVAGAIVDNVGAAWEQARAGLLAALARF